MEETRIDMRTLTPDEVAQGVEEVQLCFKLNHTMPYTDEYDELVHQLFGEFGEGSRLAAPTSVVRGKNVKIGKNVHVGTYVNMDLPYPYFIKVEDGVSLAGSITILTHNKPLEYHRNCSESYIAPVIVHKNAWVAVNVTILPGVEIGEGAIVASNSLVNKDVPPLTFCGGIPAKVIKDLSDKLKDNYTQEEFEWILKERKEKYGI